MSAFAGCSAAAVGVRPSPRARAARPAPAPAYGMASFSGLKAAPAETAIAAGASPRSPIR